MGLSYFIQKKLNLKYYLNVFKAILIPEKILYTDENKFAWVVFSVECADSILHQMWIYGVTLQSSTWMENESRGNNYHAFT